MEIKDIKEAIKGDLEAVKGDITGIVEKAKGESKEGLSALEVTLKGEIKAVNDKAAAIEVKFDEMDKQIKEAEIAAKRTKIENEKAGKPFDVILKDALTEKTDDIAKFSRKETNQIIIELKAAGDMTTGNVNGTRYGNVMAPGVIEQPKRKVHVRQLIPNGNIGPGNTYTFMRELSTGQGAPAPTAEGGAKPQFDLQLKEDNVNIEVIAGYVRVTRKAMLNIPGFIAFLQSRMPEKLLRAEDAQLLYGDGVDPNLKGLLTTGNFTAATSTASNLVEQIIDSISQLEDNQERNASGILLRPQEYYNFFKNKASGSGEYDLPKNVAFINDTLYISGIPVYASTALNATDYVVGDFDMGAQLLIQEGMRIEFFEQDANNVTTNKVTVRIEETAALPVFGADFFIKGTVPA